MRKRGSGKKDLVCKTPDYIMEGAFSDVRLLSEAFKRANAGEAVCHKPLHASLLLNALNRVFKRDDRGLAIDHTLSFDKTLLVVTDVSLHYAEEVIDVCASGKNETLCLVLAEALRRAKEELDASWRETTAHVVECTEE